MLHFGEGGAPRNDEAKRRAKRVPFSTIATLDSAREFPGTIGFPQFETRPLPPHFAARTVFPVPTYVDFLEVDSSRDTETGRRSKMMKQIGLSLYPAAYLPDCLREQGASERGLRRFLLAMRRDLRGDTTEGIS